MCNGYVLVQTEAHELSSCGCVDRSDDDSVDRMSDVRVTVTFQGEAVVVVCGVVVVVVVGGGIDVAYLITIKKAKTEFNLIILNWLNESSH